MVDSTLYIRAFGYRDIAISELTLRDMDTGVAAEKIRSHNLEILKKFEVTIAVIPNNRLRFFAGSFVGVCEIIIAPGTLLRIMIIPRNIKPLAEKAKDNLYNLLWDSRIWLCDPANRKFVASIKEFKDVEILKNLDSWRVRASALFEAYGRMLLNNVLAALNNAHRGSCRRVKDGIKFNVKLLGGKSDILLGEPPDSEPLAADLPDELFKDCDSDKPIAGACNSFGAPRPNAGTSNKNSPQKGLWTLNNLYPDFVMEISLGVKNRYEVFDVKFKNIFYRNSNPKKEDFRHDLHQILAYIGIYGRGNKRGFLLYPAEDCVCMKYTVSMGDNATEIYVVGIPFESGKSEKNRDFILKHIA